MKVKALPLAVVLFLVPSFTKAEPLFDAVSVDMGYGHAFPLAVHKMET